MSIANNIVCTLSTLDKSALLAHFVALDAEDRRLRFGHPISDEGLAQYVERLDLERDGVFVVRDEQQRIVAAAHVALAKGRAEAGLSVAPQARGLGLGTRLFERAVQFARGRGAARIDMHFISENKGMQHVARKCGMHIITHAAESEAYLLIPQPQTAPAGQMVAQTPANNGTAQAA